MMRVYSKSESAVMSMPTRHPWPTEVARRLDDICLRFEDAWQLAAPSCAGPRIEDFLNEASASERLWLLRELVGLDADYRSRRGETPPIGDYRRRFPEVDSTWLNSRLRAADQTGVWQRTSDVGETKAPLHPAGQPLGDASGVPGYEVLSVLGRGGMGVVYQARQADLGRIVALKMILAGGHAGSAERARFRAEAEAIARLQHPNIVQIFEVGEHRGQPFFSLEYCAGGSLSRKLGGTPLPPNEAAILLEALARAMHAAHLKGIIHRDLKPANVLVAEGNTPKITDFGLAKMLDQPGQTQSGVMMGTPSYMPPEQADGRLGEAGPLCDVYALGAILYECLTGRPPFKGATQLDTIAQLMVNDAVPPRQLNAQVPADLETICLKCLQKVPAKRYASAEALADDLRRFLNGEPILARPTPAWERLGKWVRRKPAVAVAVGLAVVMALSLVGLVSLYALYAAQEANVARQELRQIDEVNQLLSRSRQHADAKRWDEAGTELEKAQQALSALPAARHVELRAEVRDGLAAVREKQQERAHGQRVRKQLDAFRKPHAEALFLYTGFTGLDAVNNPARARAAARTALAIWLDEAAADPLVALDRDRKFLEPKDRAALVAGCYELLLIWADVEGAAARNSRARTSQAR